jgi:hypothetical protein
MKLLRRHYDNHLLITIIVLVILPILLAFSNFFRYIYSEKILSFSLVYFNDVYFGFRILDLFQYCVFVVMLILYPSYHNILSTERYFGKRDPRSALVEYEVLKKIIYALFPLFIFALVFIIVPRVTKENPLVIVTRLIVEPTLSSLFFTSMGVTFLIVGSALLKIIMLNARKEFRFYFAKASFRVISNKEDDMARMKHVIKGLNSYNKYLRRNLGLEIRDLKKIYSKIISDPTLDKYDSIEKLLIAFEDNDKLRTVKSLSELLRVTDTDEFLIKEPIGKKLQGFAALLGTMVSTFAAIIGVLTAFKIPGFF